MSVDVEGRGRAGHFLQVLHLRARVQVLHRRKRGFRLDRNGVVAVNDVTILDRNVRAPIDILATDRQLSDHMTASASFLILTRLE
jgi:hypothetical protein